MVSEAAELQDVEVRTTFADDSAGDDERSDVSSSAHGDDDDDVDGTLVLKQVENGRAPCFQNIEVTNSNDVHFGNKTYYQGPVTIKQVLYTNSNVENANVQQSSIKDKCEVDVETVVDGTINLGFVSEQKDSEFAKNDGDRESNLPGDKGEWEFGENV